MTTIATQRENALIRAARSLTVEHVTIVSFAVVATVAGVISFDHIRTLAGDNWWSGIYPLSIDGLMVAGSLALWRERQQGGKGNPLAWASVVLGLVWSLGANLAATNADLIPREVVDPALAVWTPVSLALAFELLIRIRRARPPRETVEREALRAERDELARLLADEREQRAILVAQPATAVESPTVPIPVPERTRPAPGAKVAAIGGSKAERGRAFVLEYIAEHGEAPNGAQVDAHVGGSSTGRAVLRKMRESGELDDAERAASA